MTTPLPSLPPPTPPRDAHWSRVRAMLIVLAAALVIILAVGTLCTLSGCGASAVQVQMRAANSVAVAANEALPALVAAYRADGLRVIADSRTEADAEAALVVVRARWSRVWGQCDGVCRGGAWPALTAAHGAWATALEQQIEGRKLDLSTAAEHATRMAAAYCALRAAAPEARLPDLPLLPCRGAP